MSEILSEFIKIKNELLDASKELTDELLYFEDLKIRKFNEKSFQVALIKIQSKLSTLCSMANHNKSDIKKIQKYADDVLTQSIKINSDDKNIGRYTFNTGVLMGMTLTYLNAINSIQFDVQKKRFSINIKSLALGTGN